METNGSQRIGVPLVAKNRELQAVQKHGPYRKGMARGALRYAILWGGWQDQQGIGIKQLPHDPVQPQPHLHEAEEITQAISKGKAGTSVKRTSKSNGSDVARPRST